MDEKIIFNDLIEIKTERDVLDFISKYGLNWKWKPIGGKENAGIIDMGSEPSDTLAERITNGIDGLLERKYAESAKTGLSPKSPREAAKLWFKIPEGDFTKLNDIERRKL